MLPFVLIGTIFTGLTVAVLLDDFKTYQSERVDINKAKEVSSQNRAVGNIINIENHTTGVKLTSSLSNSQLLHTKPMSYKVSEFKEGSFEKDIANRYAEASKIVLNNNPNEDVNCSLLVSTDLLTYDECEKIHDKNYSFFHKTEDGSLAYDLEDENVKKYALQIEANKYNIKKEELNSSDKIVLDRRFIDPNNSFLNKKNSAMIEKQVNDIKTHIASKNYLLASAGLYNLKKGNYQKIPLISSLYIQLLEDVENLTKDSIAGSYEYDLRLKIQSEFLKLTKTSNIMETLKESNSTLAIDFIRSIGTSYSTIENISRVSTKDIKSLPSKNDFLLELSKINN